MDLLKKLQTNPFATAPRFAGVIAAPKTTQPEAVATRFSASDNPILSRQELTPQYRPNEVIHTMLPGGVRDQNRTLGIG